MNLSLFQAATGMSASARWQEITAENLAASQVPGYKRQEITFEPMISGYTPAGSEVGPHYVAPRSSVHTDFTAGGFRTTGVDTDLAIDGDGFFAVQLPSGEVAYTRDGEFHRTPGGQLVTKQGYPLLGDNGPVQIDPNTAQMFINPSGEISQGTDQRGKIRIVGINDPSGLTPTGGGLYLATGKGVQETALANPVVRQGYLELSNSNPVAEMTHLISSMRMFEMNQRVIQSQDERLGKTITELSPQG